MAKHSFDEAKRVHERSQDEFKAAKAEFDHAAAAFQSRLDVVKRQAQSKKANKRAIAERAGVPFQYRDNVWVSTDSDGNTNIYFGGVGGPNGPGHGHYVTDRSGKVTYRRDPFDPHGSQNFEESGTFSSTSFRDKPQRSDPTIINTYFNAGKQDGDKHGHVKYRRNPDGSMEVFYARDVEGNEYDV